MKPSRKRRSPTLWPNLAKHILWNVEQGWKKERMGIRLDEHRGESRQMCSILWADDCWFMSHSKEPEEIERTNPRSGEVGLGTQIGKLVVVKHIR